MAGLPAISGRARHYPTGPGTRLGGRVPITTRSALCPETALARTTATSSPYALISVTNPRRRCVRKTAKPCRRQQRQASRVSHVPAESAGARRGPDGRWPIKTMQGALLLRLFEPEMGWKWPKVRIAFPTNSVQRPLHRSGAAFSNSIAVRVNRIEVSVAPFMIQIKRMPGMQSARRTSIMKRVAKPLRKPGKPFIALLCGEPLLGSNPVAPRYPGCDVLFAARCRLGEHRRAKAA
ncbi:hypothetical protein GGD40_000464 [Paraburkholderia bryophila]|uniref:Uncharacterized protein n=1 Tax=Paraburkholderia bryophila TaxID=420952 RepID=A0A7Y9WIL1_9BURK|nr:hypothetical protein [Paraburkholderia bryophila]